jgi:hypothetical protein
VSALRHDGTILTATPDIGAAGVLRDPELVAGLHKLKQTTRVGATPSRDEVTGSIERIRGFRGRPRA